MVFNILQMLIVTQLFKTIPIRLCEPNFHYLVHNSPLLDPLSCRINAVHGLTNVYSCTHFKLLKYKVIAVHAWTGPAGYWSLRLPDL